MFQKSAKKEYDIAASLSDLVQQPDKYVFIFLSSQPSPIAEEKDLYYLFGSQAISSLKAVECCKYSTLLAIAFFCISANNLRSGQVFISNKFLSDLSDT
jgi:hypothetical protein